MIGLILGLGIAQIISWGSLYYSISVLGDAMRAEIGVSELFLFGAYTAGLLVSGTLGPATGRLIDRKGGGFVLSGGSILGAIALTTIACATTPVVLVIGWLLAGAAMAATLYDPAFATLSQHTGDRYRRAVTSLTLLGGFASTVFWPFSHVLLEAWGWRTSMLVFAAIHLTVCLPIHLLIVPRRTSATRKHAHTATEEERSPAFRDPGLPWLNASFAITNFVGGVIAVHMVGLLTEVGLTSAQAVAAAMLLGPSQVGARVVEMTLLTRLRATQVGALAFLLIGVAAVVLAVATGHYVLAIAFVVMFGSGNGIFTIVRGAAPAELYGARGLGELLGYLARPSQYARALAPGAYTLILTLGLDQPSAMICLAVLMLGGLACYAIAARHRA
jgi:MFS family permease